MLQEGGSDNVITYRVNREIMSRNPEVACNSTALIIGGVLGKFGHAQEAVDFARRWVREFDGSEIPEAQRKWYGPNDLPRATVTSVNDKRALGKRTRIIGAFYKNMAGEICENRYERIGSARTTALPSHSTPQPAR